MTDAHTEHINLFDDYLTGMLSESETRGFDARLGYDAEFAEAFEKHKKLRLAIKDYYRDGLKSGFAEIDDELDSPTLLAPKNNRRQLYWWSAAAVLAVLIGITVFFTMQKSQGESATISPQQIAVKHWPYEPGLPHLMGHEDDELMRQAMTLYKGKNWEAALDKLNELPISDTVVYFEAVILYELKDYQNSLAAFEQVPESSTWHEEARFRMALIMLLSNKTKDVKSLLQNIAEGSSLFANDAKKVLKELDL